MDKEKKMVSIVIYLFNNEDIIASFTEKIVFAAEALFEKFEVIIVNDKSTDLSIMKLKETDALKNYKVSIIQMSFHQGIEMAMTAGVDLSVGDFVYEFDNLLIDYDISLFEQSYRYLLSGYDIVSVSPQKANSFMSGIFYNVYNKHSKSGYYIQSDRFRILSRRAINRAYSISNSIPYRKALYVNSGLKIGKIEFTEKKDAIRPQSKTLRNKMAINTLIIYTNLAFKISISITILLFLFTLCMCLYALVLYFGDYKPIEGWTTIIILISGSFSGLFFLIAIIIKYLSLAIEIIYNKKSYLFESVEKLS